MADKSLNNTEDSPVMPAAKKGKRAHGGTAPGDVWVVVENANGTAGRVSWE